MRTDNLYAHADDIGGVVGDFHGTPIRSMNILATDMRDLDDTQQRVRYFLGMPAATVDTLPGEVIKDNLIRRSTAAEVVGEDFYKDEVPEGKQIPLHKGLVQDPNKGELITWRPGNQDFAVLHEGVADELSA